MAFDKHLLVDAANLLNARPDLRAWLKRDRDAARARLFQQLATIHDVEALRVTAVVDGRGREIVVEHPSGQDTFTIVYTPSSLTADDVIEQMVGRSPVPSACEVATGDQGERSTIEATGAIWVPPADLWARIERAEQRLAAKVTGLNRVNAQNWRRR